jgi:DNA-binding NarL/FixJ family response regulator
MRIVLVGRPDERARLRADLEDAHIAIEAEFDSLAHARAAAVRADGVLLASPAGSRALTDTDGDWADESLTPREVDVLERLAEGLPNKVIAERLGISDQTVKFHVASIYGKLGVSNRTAAVRRAVRRGLITL